MQHRTTPPSRVQHAPPALAASLGLSASLLAGCVVAQPAAAPDAAPTHTPDPDRWRLVFADEFEGPANAAPNPDHWGYDLGGGGWGNAELQTYTDRRENARLDGGGHLVIEAHREAYTGDDGIARDYTSARLLTQGKFSTTYGRIEARVQLPQGQGIWPAVWMLGDSIATVGWPRCGEIDVMEFLGHETDTAYGTVHLQAHHGGGGIGQSVQRPDAAPMTDGFRVFAVEWTPDGLTWFLDGEPFHRVAVEDTLGPWPFDRPHFIILNLAVGGQWPGYPDETTTFPQQLLVDYVRVYEDASVDVDPDALAERDAARAEAWARVQAGDDGFDGAPTFELPGDVLVSGYREGGEGVAYHDTTPENLAGFYRATEGVDIGGGGPAEAPNSLGYVEDGEWVTYTVTTESAGRFRVEAVVACDGEGGTLRVRVTNGDEAAVVQIPDTDGWTAWRTVEADGTITLPAGESELRVSASIDAGDPRPVGNVALLRFMRVE